MKNHLSCLFDKFAVLEFKKRGCGLFAVRGIVKAADYALFVGHYIYSYLLIIAAFVINSDMKPLFRRGKVGVFRRKRYRIFLLGDQFIRQN